MESKLNRLAEIIDELAGKGVDVLHNEALRERVRAITTKTEAFIKTNPLSALGISLVLGFLLARLFSGGDEE